MSLKIRRNITIEDMQDFFGRTFDFTGWSFDSNDCRISFEMKNFDDVDILDPARPRAPISGEGVLIDMYDRSGIIMLGPEEFLALMENKNSIPRSWANDEEGEIVYIRFYRRVLVAPDSGRYVPAIFWYAGQFIPDIHDLNDLIDGTEKAAVIDEIIVAGKDVGDDDKGKSEQ